MTTEWVLCARCGWQAVGPGAQADYDRHILNAHGTSTVTVAYPHLSPGEVRAHALHAAALLCANRYNDAEPVLRMAKKFEPYLRGEA